MHIRATETTRPVPFFAAQIPCEVDKCNICNFHLACTWEAAIVATVFRDGDAQVGALDVEVREHYVSDRAPSVASR